MANLYLISQGDAAVETFQPSVPSQATLSSLGEVHVNMLAHSLRDTRFEMVYACSSPLSMETAEILNRNRKRAISVIKRLALADFKSDFDING
ncbi:MAG: hypothetical protein ACRDD9_01030, partial [Shewanella sp.]